MSEDICTCFCHATLTGGHKTECISCASKHNSSNHICIGCSQEIDKCNCVWGKFRELYKMHSDLSIKIESWQKGYEVWINVLEEKIKELQDLNERQNDRNVRDNRRIKDIVIELNDCDERITYLENIECEVRLLKLEEYLSLLKINDLTEVCVKMAQDLNKNLGKVPHKCPVCNGQAIAIHPLTGLLVPAVCHACNGKGIVWG